jgi:hypothetical protein
MVSTLTTRQETAVGELLAGLLMQFGGAIEFWTLVCLSERELGDPTVFVDRQWNGLREQLQELRARLSEGESEPSDAALEQVAKLSKACAELREVFDYFLNAAAIAQSDLEAAVVRLAQIWQDVRMRVWLLGALIPLPEGPSLSMEKEAYYQSILDRLFDQFMAARTASELHERNGKMLNA